MPLGEKAGFYHKKAHRANPPVTPTAKQQPLHDASKMMLVGCVELATGRRDLNAIK